MRCPLPFAAGLIVVAGCAAPGRVAARDRSPAAPAASSGAPASTSPSAVVAAAARKKSARVAAVMSALRESRTPPETSDFDRDERVELAEEAARLVADPPPMMPLLPTFLALDQAWSPEAEAILVPFVLADDRGLRIHATEILRAQKLSKVALVRDRFAAVSRPSPALIEDAIVVMGTAPDADAKTIAEACRTVRAEDAVDWTCKAVLTRLGDREARVSLARKVRIVAERGSVGEAETRIAWLEQEVGDKGPWSELADLVDNPRRPPVVKCIKDDFCGTCEMMNRAPHRPLGDFVLRAIARRAGLALTFDPERTGSFTVAEREEVKRKARAKARSAD